ncbi:hypothetical protein ID850_12900 [Xenorhabdus sp. Flor]|nr:hypothetical protein [Xenorhabdus sp. Flor]
MTTNLTDCVSKWAISLLPLRKKLELDRYQQSPIKIQKNNNENAPMTLLIFTDKNGNHVTHKTLEQILPTLR